MLGILRPPREELLEDLTEQLPTVIPAGLPGQKPEQPVPVRFEEGLEHRLIDHLAHGDRPARLGRIATEPRT
ncbi:hypothetical protein ACWD01_36075 [Streptomyces sp. NPDC002835]